MVRSGQLWRPCQAAAGQLSVRAEGTPNARSRKFTITGLPDGFSSEGVHLRIDDPSQHQADGNLLGALVRAGGPVTDVFVGPDFVSVNLADADDWTVGTNEKVTAAIFDHISGGNKLLDADMSACSEQPSSSIPLDDSDPVVRKIQEVVAQRIRPSVQADGGDLAVVGFEPDTGTVHIQLLGACDGCAASASTLQDGVKRVMMFFVPEVRSVVPAAPTKAEQVGMEEFEALERRIASASMETDK